VVGGQGGGAQMRPESWAPCRARFEYKSFDVHGISHAVRTALSVVCHALLEALTAAVQAAPVNDERVRGEG